MRVTIWDLDYYYAKNRINCFNPDVMKLSSYYKQLGHSVNFVRTEDDIRRPYDLYYIFRNDVNTPNAPRDFLINPKVKWAGKAMKGRWNWKMSDAMLACRPDYLLYPEKNTKIERAEQIRLFNNKGELLPLTQDWTNSFKNKRAIVTDITFWTSSRENIITALKQLAQIKNISFYKPIWIQKLIKDEELINLFMELQLTPGSNISWLPITLDEYADAKEIIKKLKGRWPNTSFGPLVIKLFPSKHWKDRQYALKDLAQLENIIVDAKKQKIRVELKMFGHRLDSPYFHLFECISMWTKNLLELSWLEYITKMYGNGLKFTDNIMFWSDPSKWSSVFRDLLRQTWQNEYFLLWQWGDKMISFNEIPWGKWQKEFEYGI